MEQVERNRSRASDSCDSEFLNSSGARQVESNFSTRKTRWDAFLFYIRRFLCVWISDKNAQFLAGCPDQLPADLSVLAEMRNIISGINWELNCWLNPRYDVSMVSRASPFKNRFMLIVSDTERFSVVSTQTLVHIIRSSMTFDRPESSIEHRVTYNTKWTYKVSDPNRRLRISRKVITINRLIFLYFLYIST